MADTLIKMKTGTIAKLEQKNSGIPVVPLDKGTVYFAVDTDNHIGQIVYDAPVGTNGVDRIVMSTQAERADTAAIADNVSGVVGIANGGTGGITASAARSNLGIGNSKVFVGTCSTAAGTVAKEVVCTEFTSVDLVQGSIILVSFDNTNSGAVANLTLNVNNTGAKPIKKYYNYGISNLTDKGELIANSVIPFIYNGTNWIAFGLDYNSTYSSLTQAEANAGTATTGRAITAKVLYDTITNRLSNTLSDINAMIYKGTVAAATDIPDTHEAGWVYKIATAGTYVGENCEVGDIIICVVDGTTANNDDWIVIQKNVDKALFKSTNTFTNEHMLLADGTDGKVKSVAINPTLTLTSGTASAAPKLKIAVGGKNSSESSLNTATTGLYGVTKLSNTASSTEEGLAATPKLVSTSISSAINGLDVTDSAVTGKYVSTVSETNGKISVTKADFNPSVSVGAGTADAGPTIGISVGGADSATTTIGTATTGLYGVTKLTNTVNANEESLAATPKLVSTAVSNGINGLDVSDTADSTKYVSAVSETNGKISVSRATFSPSITVTSGDSSNAPKINVTVAGNTGTAQALNTATTGVYGVTKLSNTSSANEDGLAATPKGVWAAINTLDGAITGTPSAATTLTAFNQTNGKVTATFEDIAINASQVTAGTLPVSRGGTGQTSVANIKAGKDASGNTITTTYATKAELNNLLALNDAMIFKGTISTASDVPSPPYDAGWVYKVATFGTYAGKICEVGDLFICVKEKAAGATASNDDWMVVQTNLDNGLFKGTNIFSDGQMLLADSTVGKVKAVDIDPTINMTGGTSSAAPQFTISVGGETSSSASIGTATTGVYGATKLSDAINSTSTSLAATANAVRKAYNLAASKTDNIGTITGVTAGTGLTGGGTSGTVTLNHSNSIDAITTEDLYKIKFDGQGHITGALIQGITDNSSSKAVTNTDTNLITARTLYYAGYTKNTGTVTSVTLTQGDGITISNSGTAITSSGSRTISHTVPSGASASTYGIANSRAYIQTITTDQFGHVTGITTGSETVTNTHYQAKNVVANSNTATSTTTTALTNGNVYLNLVENSAVRSAFKINGSNLVGVTADANGNINVAHTAPANASSGAKGSSGRTYLQTITTDEYGHVTGYTTASETVTDTHHQAKGVITNSTTGKTQTTSALTNGNVYLNIIENNAVRSSHKISGANVIGVTSDSSGNLSVGHTAPSGASEGAKGGSGRTYLQTITTDAYGHITGYTTGTETVTNSDTKVNVTLATTTKAYLLGTSTTPTATAQGVTAIADTGVYLDTTAGKLTATSFAGNGASLTSLNASNISSGTLAKERLATSGVTAGTYQGITVDAYGRVTGAVNQGYTTNTGTVTKITAGTGLNTSADQADSATKGSITTTGTLYLTTSGVTANSYGPSANASPAHSGTFSVPYITVDKYGRVTAASTKTITLPADNNTDTKVTNTLGTTTKYYITGTTSTSTNTGTQTFDTGVYVTTTAGELNAKQYKVDEAVTLEYNSTTKSLDFIFN